MRRYHIESVLCVRRRPWRCLVAILAGLFVLAFGASRAYAGEGARGQALVERARAAQAQRDMEAKLAAYEANQKKRLDDFVADHPAAPGSDEEFPYDRALLPMLDAPRGSHATPSLCIDKRGTDARLWCNSVGGPSVVSGDRIMIIIDQTTQVYCREVLDSADGAFRDLIEGENTWRRDGENFWLGRPGSASIPIGCPVIHIGRVDRSGCHCSIFDRLAADS